RVLEPPEILDLQLDERRLVGLRRGAPAVEGLVLGGRNVTVEVPLLTRVVREQVVPVEGGPPLRLHEGGGAGDGLGAELGYEPGEQGDGAQRGGKAVEGTVVPAEVEVRVGAGAAEAREHTRVRVDGAARIGAVQRAGDRAVEHVLVPSR